ncbi:MAG: hypothetical protein AAB110_00555 [Candidatus Desantisbacteria bacterium]
MNRLLVIGGISVALIAGMVSMGGADPIVNVGEVKYADEAGNTSTRVSEPAVINGPYLVITKKASRRDVKQGERFTYTITVKNIGSQPARNVVVKDRLPDELKFIENSQRCSRKDAKMSIEKGSTILKYLLATMGAGEEEDFECDCECF